MSDSDVSASLIRFITQHPLHITGTVQSNGGSRFSIDLTLDWLNTDTSHVSHVSHASQASKEDNVKNPLHNLLSNIVSQMHHHSRRVSEPATDGGPSIKYEPRSALSAHVYSIPSPEVYATSAGSHDILHTIDPQVQLTFENDDTPHKSVSSISKAHDEDMSEQPSTYPEPQHTQAPSVSQELHLDPSAHPSNDQTGTDDQHLDIDTCRPDTIDSQATSYHAHKDSHAAHRLLSTAPTETPQNPPKATDSSPETDKQSTISKTRPIRSRVLPGEMKVLRTRKRSKVDLWAGKRPSVSAKRLNTNVVVSINIPQIGYGALTGSRKAVAMIDRSAIWREDNIMKWDLPLHEIMKYDHSIK
eukprot:gnl/Dysnectes_brevis/5680_a8301_593.p1 GENE.gnl/Dysnectes_brevis/5680_a8301_593~~gnl/Dysnectes_brevis/5680_a8301_593.p1  ORF type:complete len:358 (+),score=-9.84 gnl/Dysnectes_brevis/5680_a8301_593:33-1106(+)